MRGVPRGVALRRLASSLLCPLSRRVYLRFFDALFAVGTIPQFHELLASFGAP